MMSYNINVVLIYYIGNDELECVVSVGSGYFSQKYYNKKKIGRRDYNNLMLY